MKKKPENTNRVHIFSPKRILINRKLVLAQKCYTVGGERRFNTRTSAFVYSDQYIQLTTELPSDNVYGFGEHNHRRFRHDMNWKKWTIFTRDVAPVVRQSVCLSVMAVDRFFSTEAIRRLATRSTNLHFTYLLTSAVAYLGFHKGASNQPLPHPSSPPPPSPFSSLLLKLQGLKIMRHLRLEITLLNVNRSLNNY